MENIRPIKKILLVGQWFISEQNGKIVFPGGTERYVFGLAKQLQSDGYKVTVLSVTTNKDEVGWKTIDKIKIYFFMIPDKFRGYFIDVLSFIHTLKLILKYDFDIVHIISARYRFGVGAIMASKILLKKKTVFTLTIIPTNANRKTPYFLDNNLFNRIIRRSDIIISLSKEMKKDLIPSIPDMKIVIIPSFYLDGYFKKNTKKKNSILFVGRLEIDQKGIDFLIKSLIYVKERCSIFKLHIIGKGKSLDYLVKLVSDYGLENNVDFHGHVEEDELIKIYSTSEIFVLPSLHEGMPMVLLEAMSAGLPVIAFDIDPVVEALDNGKYGILVKTGDIKGLADEITRLLNNDDIKEYYSIMSLERSKKYTQVEVVRQIEKVYSKIIEAL
jgi:glycosyltransferase involved in cell wall biosynthesis